MRFPPGQPFLRLPAGFGFESRTADCTESAVERVIESATVKLGHDLATETCLTCMWFYRSPWVCEGTLSHIHYFKKNGMENSLHHPQSRLELHARLDAIRGGEENPRNLARSMNQRTRYERHSLLFRCPLCPAISLTSGRGFDKGTANAEKGLVRFGWPFPKVIMLHEAEFKTRNNSEISSILSNREGYLLTPI